jgi:hypothetical protein
MKWIYREKTEQQLKNWFYQKPKNKRGFKTFKIFFSWYNDFVKDKYCHYCGAENIRPIQAVTSLPLSRSCTSLISERTSSISERTSSISGVTAV